MARRSVGSILMLALVVGLLALSPTASADGGATDASAPTETTGETSSSAAPVGPPGQGCRPVCMGS